MATKTSTENTEIAELESRLREAEAAARETGAVAMQERERELEAELRRVRAEIQDGTRDSAALIEEQEAALANLAELRGRLPAAQRAYEVRRGARDSLREELASANGRAYEALAAPIIEEIRAHVLAAFHALEALDAELVARGLTDVRMGAHRGLAAAGASLDAERLQAPPLSSESWVQQHTSRQPAAAA